MHLFNAVISIVLGLSFFHSRLIFGKKEEEKVQIIDQQKEHISQENITPLSKLPVKKGDSFFLIPLEEIVYFEAYDNYSFVYDIRGKKRLCDYSLLFLQKRLDDSFLRVHRKYIVNSIRIKHIQPHLNGRYHIQFDIDELDPIISSKGYASSVRALIRIE